MGPDLTYAPGATPLDPDERAALIPRHIATQDAGQDLAMGCATSNHRLVSIHPFANGNGRFARLMTDLLLERNGEPPFAWGNADLVAAGEARDRYISALRAADGRDYGLLLEFVEIK